MNELLSEQLSNKLRNKKVLVVGLGLQGGGVGLVKFLDKMGAEVTVTDLRIESQLASSIDKLKDISYKSTFGGHKEEDFLNADIIFKGPSVPWTHPLIQKAEQTGIRVEMESAFFAAHCPVPIIGVTGTRGKSTVTHMISAILKRAGRNVLLGGNIPNVSTINLLSDIEDDTQVILELPSWHLSGFHRRHISPHIGVFTNIFPDHLNYYKDMDEYVWDKKAIYLYQGIDDHLVANKNLEEVISKDDRKGTIHFFEGSDFAESMRYLRGPHNVENAAAAAEVARLLGINESHIATSLSEFRGVPFRQEVVGTKDNVFFINDTTSTTPAATIAALKSFPPEHTVLILGGDTKNLPTTELVEALNSVNSIVLVKGTFTDEILIDISQKYQNKTSSVLSSLSEAVDAAYRRAAQIKSDAAYVLFSPSATSFAQFANEFDRGGAFNQEVKKLTTL